MRILVVALALTSHAWCGIVFSDSFEGASFDPFWTLTQQLGTITLSTDQSNTGSQSAKFASTGGGQREIILSHLFPNAMYGAASVAFFDNAPNQETLFEKLFLSDSQSGISASVGTQDFDAFCYSTAVNGSGPNANCGVFPQTSTTNVARTSGWHLFSITMDPSATTVSIDGTQIFSLAQNLTFDTVDFEVTGPGFRPDTVAYIDDFNLAATDAPEPGSLGLVVIPLVIGGVLIRRGLLK